MSKTPARRRVLLVLLTCLGLAVAGMVAGPADAAKPAKPGSSGSPAPVRIQIDRIWSDAHAAPEGTPAGSVPTLLVVAGDHFYVDVSFWDAGGDPASFNSDTTLDLSSSAGPLTPATVVVPAGEDTFELTTSLDHPANQVAVTVSVPGKGKKSSGVTPGTSSSDQLFDVLSELRFEDSNPHVTFAQGIGGSENCAEATKEQPVCAIVLLPNGANSQVLLSLGPCDATYAACGSNRGVVVQTLADLAGLYSKTDPATVVVKCDKSLCKGGAIKNYSVVYTFAGNGGLGRAEACPAKATIGTDQDACVDYVQSTRDGAGDTWLYLLVAGDLRVGMG